MRQVEMSAEVAAALGAEQVERLTSGNWAQRVQCWDCNGWLEPTEPAAVLLLRPVDFGQGTVRFAVHAHPRCASSQVREVTLAELAARRAELGLDVDDADDGADVDVVPMVWNTGRGGYAAVFLSYHQELMIEAGPERRDGVVSALLEQGWHLVADLNTLSAPAPAGWRLRFTHTSGHATGVLELSDPDGVVVTTAHVEPPRLWRPAVVATGQALVVHGSRYLTDLATTGVGAISAAARAGSLVAGFVPVELVGPDRDITS